MTVFNQNTFSDKIFHQFLEIMLPTWLLDRVGDKKTLNATLKLMIKS